MVILEQESFINGTFRLDNTQSLEKFKELEKLCTDESKSQRDSIE